ncbi:hypothetical protein ATCC90586_002818 [Pythium insidiosum]|nr:hypothetical protein ATCC90586_002818 [Pythium insidiosum]
MTAEPQLATARGPTLDVDASAGAALAPSSATTPESLVDAPPPHPDMVQNMGTTHSASEDAPPRADDAAMPTAAHAPALYPMTRRRLSSTPSTSTAVDVGAPSVWTTPDWATHPVIESFYGCARRRRENSFYEVMQSPTNVQDTRPLAETCNGYDGDDCERRGLPDDDDDHDAPPSRDARASTRPFKPATAAAAAAGSARPRKLGSFSYSCSSDEVTASPFHSSSNSTAGSRFEGAAGQRLDRDDSTSEGDDPVGASPSASAPAPPVSSDGYATWNRLWKQEDKTAAMVPIPTTNGLLKKSSALSISTSHLENPQGGQSLRGRGDSTDSEGASPTQASGSPEPRPPPSAGRLRTKLQQSLAEIDDRIQVELEMAKLAHANMRNVPSPREPSAVWTLLCGARTTSAVAQHDGLDALHDALSVSLHNRALNQLQRHRRHVNGILQIVTSHNPDLHLTERQLDTFESASAMLANDVKFSTLQQQVDTLAARLAKRQEAMRHAKLKNGHDCFQSTRQKSAMLVKLLEAVSWYRLVQTNSREESASSSVGLSPTVESDTAAGDAAEPPSSSSSSCISASRSLQELQVERILSVLAGEEFYSDYNELMCQPDWWEIAQAHFENIIFSRPESRICQWMSRISRDVAAVSYEALEDAALFKIDDKKSSQRSQSQRLADWTRDPQPEQIMEFVERLTRRIRKEFDVPSDVTKSISYFIQRTVFSRLALLCYNQKAVIDSQRKDKLWRKRCADLSGIPMENLNISSDLAGRIRSMLPSRRVPGGRAFLIRAIDAFNSMTSIVPCDLLDELMYGVIILHHEAALVLGTTQFSVETFFPLLAYVLLHCHLPTIHAQLHFLENYAITDSNVNGEESYYVYCVHAAVEYVCNSAGLSTAARPLAEQPTPGEAEKKQAGEAASLTSCTDETPAEVVSAV